MHLKVHSISSGCEVRYIPRRFILLIILFSPYIFLLIFVHSDQELVCYNVQILVCFYLYFFLQISFFFKKLFIYLFIFGCTGSSLLHAGFLQLQRVGATLCCSAQASCCGGFSCCGARAQARGLHQSWLVGSRAQTHQWCTSLAAPRHVGSSQNRARTHVPCIGRRTPKRWATREALSLLLIVAISIIKISFFVSFNAFVLCYTQSDIKITTLTLFCLHLTNMPLPILSLFESLCFRSFSQTKNWILLCEPT